MEKLPIDIKKNLEHSPDWIKSMSALKKVWANVEENHHMFIDMKKEESYYRTMEKILPVYASASEDFKVLTEKICAQLFHFSGQDMIAALDPRIYPIIENVITLDSIPDFGEHLKILSRIENMQSTGPIVFKDEDSHLIKVLNERANKPEANMLLANYIHALTDNPKSHGYYDSEHAIPIGGGRFIDVSDGIWEDSVRISQTDGTWENIKPSHFLSGKELLNNQSLTTAFSLLWTNDHFRETIEKNVGVQFTDYSIPEQFQTLAFLSETKNKDMERVQKFSNTYGKSGFRTFLSLEHGGKEMGNNILTLSEKLPKESVELLFKKYGEIIDEVNNVAEYFSTSLNKVTAPELIEQTKEQLLIKGKDMLVYYAGHAKTCDEQECVDLGAELETRLKDLKASVVLLGSAVKTLVAHGEFNLQDLKDIEISYNQNGLEEKDKETIRKISQENTKQYPEKLREYWRGTAEQALEHPAPGETFISVKFKDEIVVVMRVAPQDDGSFYGGSFNVNPNIRGSRIGTELMKKVIDNYTKQGDFVADCYEHNPMLENYTGKFGFEIIDTIENYNDTGATIKKIIRRKQTN